MTKGRKFDAFSAICLRVVSLLLLYMVLQKYVLTKENDELRMEYQK